MNEVKGSRFIFGPYSMDPGRRLLQRGDQGVTLTPKEFDTLLALLEAGGTVVGKEELIARVWPDSYVGDSSLARNISVLRRALGEEVIETLPRRGYRITMDVAVVANGASGVPVTSPVAEAATAAAGADSVVESAAWWKQKFVMGSTVAIALLIAIVASRFFAIKTAKAHSSAPHANPIRSILIQKEGAIDPLDEGFRLVRPDGNYHHPVYNPETNGWDRWRIVTDDQNFYVRKLSDEEKDFALQRDWRLTCVCAVEKGGGFLDVDFAGKGPRFDIELLQEGTRYFVGLTQQISPTIELQQKIEFPGVGDVAHPHTYELRYEHASQTASLWIDGRLRASGYRGHHQFQENLGLMFGVARYLDAATSSMVFRSVRFEAQ